MPSITPGSYTVPLIPRAYVTFGAQPDLSLVCTNISITAKGATATIEAPLMFADTPASAYYMSPVTIYVDDYPTPVFRGFFDTSIRHLRAESVTFTARSVWSFLQDIKLFTPHDYNLIAGGLTTQANPLLYILADNPYTHDNEARVWQPAEIVNALQARLDGFWQAHAMLMTDPNIPQVLPIEQTVYSIGYDALTEKPTFTSGVRNIAPYPEIVLRESTTIGEAMDMVCELVPGTQVFELFTNEGTQVYVAYPQSFGGLIGTAGVPGMDWRDMGGNIVDLDIEAASGSSTNRVIARGAQASCVVTLMSETGVEGDEGVQLTGLIPDWDLYTESTSVEVKGLQGVSLYKYNDDCEYEVNGIHKQTIHVVMDNPYTGKPGQPEYVSGYENVGRRYRLPNWFEFAEIENNGNVLVDKATGRSVKVQAFYEAAVYQGETEGPPPVGFYKYCWFETKDFVFNQREKTITFGNVYITDFLGKVGSDLWQVRSDLGPKLCRVAVTLTYSHPAYSMVVDSYLDAGMELPQFQGTAIETGNAYTFSDDSLGWTQASNINMPFITSYGERYVSGEKRIKPFPLAAPASVVYPELILAAHTEDAPDTQSSANVMTYLTETFGQHNPGNQPAFTVPFVLRDDSARLRSKCYQVLYQKLRKARTINATFRMLLPYARRGMTFVANNFNGLDQPAGDIINQVSHDFVTGATTVRTTNQLASDQIDVEVGNG